MSRQPGVTGKRLIATLEVRGLNEFVSRSVRLQGGFTLAVPVEEAFLLFSPLGEKLWVPGWDPELLHPPDASWEEGQIFRTQEQRGEGIWIVTRLGGAAHRVEYHRVESERYVAHISVGCAETADGGTQVSTEYEFIGLSESGNAEIAAMTQDDYHQKMTRWSRWIHKYLAARSQER